MGERPVSVTIFGILNLAFAVFGFGSLALSKVLLSLGSLPASSLVRSFNDNPVYAAWMKVSTVMGLVSNTVLLAAGIGLLLLKNWGRITSIVYGVYAVLRSLAGAVVSFAMVESVLHQSQARFESIAAVVGLVAAGVGLVLSLVYPVLLLVFMTRPKVVAAFGPAAPINQFAMPATPPGPG